MASIYSRPLPPVPSARKDKKPPLPRPLFGSDPPPPDSRTIDRVLLVGQIIALVFVGVMILAQSGNRGGMSDAQAERIIENLGQQREAIYRMASATEEQTAATADIRSTMLKINENTTASRETHEREEKATVQLIERLDKIDKRQLGLRRRETGMLAPLEKLPTDLEFISQEKR